MARFRYVADIFTSRDGENIAYTVLRKSIPHCLKECDVDGVVNGRLQLLSEVQKVEDGENGPLKTNSLIRVEAKKRRWIVHRFLLELRCPSLLEKVKRQPSSGMDSIDFGTFDDDTVEELLELLYTDASRTLRIVQSIASERGSTKTAARLMIAFLDEIRCFLDGVCALCEHEESRDELVCNQWPQWSIFTNALLIEGVEKQLSRLLSVASHAGMMQLTEKIQATLENILEVSVGVEYFQ